MAMTLTSCVIPRSLFIEQALMLAWGWGGLRQGQPSDGEGAAHLYFKSTLYFFR